MKPALVGSASVLAALLATVVALTGCSSSSAPGNSDVPARPDPTTSAAVASSPTSTPPPSVSTSAAPKPLSPYENDPAVKALRAWAAQAGRTVNTGKYDDAALNALMTPSLVPTMKHDLGDEVGHYYPGPLPFTPVTVTVNSARSRDVHMCVLAGGYSLNPKTHKPFSKRSVIAIDAGAVRSGQKWLVSKLDNAGFSCKGVKIREQSWPN